MDNLNRSSNCPLVIVVTPSFNQGSFIRETIESVLSQDYAAIEYLAIDGASTDDTLAVLKSYGVRPWWYSEPNRGQAHAVNEGSARATGDWLCFPIASDYWIASTRLAQAALRLKEFSPRYVVNEEM